MKKIIACAFLSGALLIGTSFAQTSPATTGKGEEKKEAPAVKQNESDHSGKKSPKVHKAHSKKGMHKGMKKKAEVK